MRIGTVIADYLRREVPPSPVEIDELERVLNLLELNNAAPLHWPGNGVVDFDDVVRESSAARPQIRVTKTGEIRSVSSLEIRAIR